MLNMHIHVDQVTNQVHELDGITSNPRQCMSPCWQFEREKGLESSRLSRPERLEGTAFLVAATAAGCIFL